jgi:ABC-type uncharacterized transport system permease subunit
MNYWTLLFASLILYLIPSFSLIAKTTKITTRHNYILLSIGLVAHIALIYISLFNHGINLNFSNALLVISWITILFFCFMNRNKSYEGLEYLTLMPAIIILIFHPFIHPTNYVSDYSSIKAVFHIIIAILGYSLLAFGAIFSIFILLIQNNIHSTSKPTEIFKSNVSLLAMEKLLFQIYWIGFIFLTITLITGIFFSEEILGIPLGVSHKIIFSILSWLVYGGLLLGRAKAGWRGKKAIIFSLIAFILLFMSYLGSKFVLEVIIGG